MKYFLNIGHCSFDLLLGGSTEVLVGKMVHCDETGTTIIEESTGLHHSYAPGVVQHIKLAD